MTWGCFVTKSLPIEQPRAESQPTSTPNEAKVTSLNLPFPLILDQNILIKKSNFLHSSFISW